MTDAPESAAGTERPGWAPPCDIGPYLMFDFVFVHAGAIVPGGVVFAHMFETEQIIAVEIVAGTGCPVFAGFLATGRIATLRPVP